MIPQIFLGIFFITSIISFYKIKTGFALVVFWRLVIPPMVRIGPGAGGVGSGSAGLSLNSCFIIMLFLVLIVNSFKNKKTTLLAFQKKIPFPKKVGYFIIGLFTIAIFSYDFDIIYRFGSLFQFIYTEFSLAFIAWYLYKDSKDIEYFIKLLSIAALIIAIYGVFCYLTLTNPLITLINVVYKPTQDFLNFMDEERGGLAGRIQGTMVHPLMWGGTCMLLFFFFFRNNPTVSKTLRAFLLVLLVANTVFSGSRAAVLAVMAGFGMLFLISKSKTKIKYFTYSALGFLVLTIAIYQSPALAKFQPFFESTFFFWQDTRASHNITGSSSSMRWHQLEGSIHMIDESPLFGLGPGYIKYYSLTYGIHPILFGFESIVFMALVETGFLGLGLWILLLLFLFKLIDRIKRTYKLGKSNNILLLKSYVAAYVVFIVFTGVQATFYLFLVLYVMQINYLIIGESKLEVAKLQPSEATS